MPSASPRPAPAGPVAPAGSVAGAGPFALGGPVEPTGPAGAPASAVPTVAIAVAVVLCGVTPIGYPDPFPGGADIPAPLDRVTLLDLTLVLVVLAVAVFLPPRRWLPEGRVARGLVGAFVLVALGSAARHPSALGVEALLRWTAAAATVAWLGHAGPAARTRVATTAVVAVAAQAALGLVQVTTGRLLVPGGFEWYSELWTFGGTVAGQGWFRHPYFLGWWSLAAAGVAAGAWWRTGRRAWLAGVAAGGLGVGLSCSRAVALGTVATAVVVAAWPLLPRARAAGAAGATGAAGARWRAALVALAALAVGGGVGVTATFDGWSQRVASSTSGSAVEVSTARTTRWDEAVDLWRAEPLLGVGPGNYLTARAARPDRPDLPQPAHQVLLQAAASMGALGALVVLAAGAAAGRWFLRRPALAAPAAGLLPAFLLDPFPVVAPGGIVLVAVVAGLALGEAQR